jgi:phospholipid transport system substrate-binding protein
MISSLFHTLRRGLLVALATLPLFALAAPSAQQVVQQTTDELIGDLKTNKDSYRQNPSAFYEALNRILGPVVDSDGISRSIMTVKYSRAASPEQMKRFEENFKRSLMQFYGNALLEYDNQGIRVLPAKPESDGRASVGMEVQGKNGVVYPVTYTMTQVDGQWLMRNVIINGINIGKLFRDQFADAMQKNGNDLDKTIDGWANVVAKAKNTEAGQQAAGVKDADGQ